MSDTGRRRPNLLVLQPREPAARALGAAGEEPRRKAAPTRVLAAVPPPEPHPDASSRDGADDARGFPADNNRRAGDIRWNGCEQLRPTGVQPSARDTRVAQRPTRRIAAERPDCVNLAGWPLRPIVDAQGGGRRRSPAGRLRAGRRHCGGDDEGRGDCAMHGRSVNPDVSAARLAAKTCPTPFRGNAVTRAPRGRRPGGLGLPRWRGR